VTLDEARIYLKIVAYARKETEAIFVDLSANDFSLILGSRLPFSQVLKVNVVFHRPWSAIHGTISLGTPQNMIPQRRAGREQQSSRTYNLIFMLAGLFGPHEKLGPESDGISLPSPSSSQDEKGPRFVPRVRGSFAGT
jgi:hypothetical protein